MNLDNILNYSIKIECGDNVKMILRSGVEKTPQNQNSVKVSLSCSGYVVQARGSLMTDAVS